MEQQIWLMQSLAGFDSPFYATFIYFGRWTLITNISFAVPNLPIFLFSPSIFLDVRLRWSLQLATCFLNRWLTSPELGLIPSRQKILILASKPAVFNLTLGCSWTVGYQFLMWPTIVGRRVQSLPCHNISDIVSDPLSLPTAKCTVCSSNHGQGKQTSWNLS